MKASTYLLIQLLVNSISHSFCSIMEIHREIDVSIQDERMESNESI